MRIMIQVGSHEELNVAASVSNHMASARVEFHGVLWIVPRSFPVPAALPFFLSSAYLPVQPTAFCASLDCSMLSRVWVPLSARTLSLEEAARHCCVLVHS
mmetsp:Transcript_4100/g.14675  ORF Transcript_4100/g.14675 Transcript_4100/m.14675 type:complete len:100 (-) Transcript_4100:2000-2299(-)